MNSLSQASTKRMPGRPKKSVGEVPEDIRLHLITSAKVLFREKGYVAVSMRDIVKETGVSLPTVYYYFKDKEALFVAVLVEMMKLGQGHFIQEINPSRSLEENLKALAIGYLRYSPTSMTAMLRDVEGHMDELASDTILQAYDSYLVAPFRQLFGQAQEQGVLRTDLILNDITWVFLGLLDSFRVSLVSQLGQTFDCEYYGSLSVNIFLNGVSLPVSERI